MYPCRIRFHHLHVGSTSIGLRSVARSKSRTKRVGDLHAVEKGGQHVPLLRADPGRTHLESLEGVTALGLLPDDVHDTVDKLGTLGVVTGKERRVSPADRNQAPRAQGGTHPFAQLFPAEDCPKM